MKRVTPMERNLGAKIRYYRERKNWVQEDLAAHLATSGCDLTRVMIGHIETGRRGLSIYEIDKLVEVLGIDYNALFAQD